MLGRESEAEVQQFLRGSLAVPYQQQQQQEAMAAAGAVVQASSANDGACGNCASSPNSCSAQQPAGKSMHASPAQSVQHSPPADSGAAGGAAAPRWYGSLDLVAILDSRPVSPAKLPQLDSSSSGSDDGADAEAWRTARSDGGEGWHTARSGSASGRMWQARAVAQGCLSTSDDSSSWAAEASEQQRQPTGSMEEEGELAVADLQLLRISSRPASPSQRQRGSGSRAGSLSDVITQTFPEEARERLGQLKAHLSPSVRPQPDSAGSPGGSPNRGSRAAASSHSPPRQAAAGAFAVTASSAGSGSRQGSPELLPRRIESPELPGLRISRRQAQLLQSAVGRMPGGWAGGNPTAVGEPLATSWCA